MSNRISVPISNGFRLVAEQSSNPDYPREIYIGIEDAQGAWVQDLVIVMNTYRYKKDGQLDYTDDRFDIMVYGDHRNEDYTEKIQVHLREDDI